MTTCLPDGSPYPYRERLLNDFTTRSFRDTADGDYIAARMAFRATLVPQFLWLSLQCLEKYLKCILVLNRVSARRHTRHELNPLLKQFRAAGKFEIKMSNSSRTFVDYLDTYGRHRYFETSYYAQGLEIMQLDRAAWELRRYAHVIDYYSTMSGRVVHLLEPQLRQLENASRRPHRYQILGGALEKIIAKRGHPAREPLLWQNAFFGERHRRTVRLARHFRVANSPLSVHPEILAEVLKYVYLPSDVVEGYRQLAHSQKKSVTNQP